MFVCHCKLRYMFQFGTRTDLHKMQFGIYALRWKVCRAYLPIKLFDLFVQFNMYKMLCWLYALRRKVCAQRLSEQYAGLRQYRLLPDNKHLRLLC